MTLGQNSEGRELKGRLVYLGLAMFFGLLMLAMQLYRLQIIRHEEFKAKSIANSVDEVRQRADRGMITDVNGEILVDNRPSDDVFITPAYCQKCFEDVLPRLATYLRWDLGQLAKVETKLKSVKRSDRFRPLPVKIDISADERDLLYAHMADPAELPGVSVQHVQHRNYRFPRSDTGQVMTGLAHVLGYMNEIQPDEFDKLNASGSTYQLGDFIGRNGIEKYYEPKLRGVDGFERQIVDARGRVILDMPVPEPRRVAPTPGNNLRLSIDQRLQLEAERAFPGTAGAVVLLDVKTGFILAMVSRPAYDSNMMTGRVSAKDMLALREDKLEPMIFRPVAQHYAPGSTFKVVTMLAALESGQFKSSSTVFCTGGYRLGARTWRCHLDRGHGTRDARQAMQSSCDTWFFRVADSLGIDPIGEMGKSLGLGAPTGIGFGEVPGIMPTSQYHNRVTPGGYQKGMALNTAIGQGDDNVTPLQLAMVYAAIANGGDVYRPQLVKKIESVDGKYLQEFQPQLLRHVTMAPEHRQVVMDGLIAVVNEPGGTAYRSRLKDVVVAGKTGTAQVRTLGKVRLKSHEMSYFERDHAWFAAFAPADNPEVAIVVLNEHSGHGGSEAAPTAAAVLRKYFDLKHDAARAAAGPSDGVGPLTVPPVNAPPAPRRAPEPPERTEALPPPPDPSTLAATPSDAEETEDAVVADPEVAPAPEPKDRTPTGGTGVR